MNPGDVTPAQSPPAMRDPRLRTAIVAVVVVALGFCVAALLVFGLRVTASVAIGGAIAVLNLWAVARVIGALLPSGPTAGTAAEAQSRGGWVLVALLKMLGLVAVVWLLMRHGVASPLPMVVGFGSLPIGIVIGSLVSDRSALGPARQD
jgi:hypothetical protein